MRRVVRGGGGEAVTEQLVVKSNQRYISRARTPLVSPGCHDSGPHLRIE